MIILQAAFADAFLVWGETPRDSGRTQQTQKRTKLPLTSPFDAGAAILAEALGDLLPAKAKPETAIIWLPTSQQLPVPSSSLLGDIPDNPAAIELSAWALTAYRLPAEATIDLLCRGMDQPTLAPGVIVGKTLAYWTKALRFAAALVARQQFLPAITPPRPELRVRGKGEGSQAYWEPVLAGPDASRLTQLASAMPPPCRALGAGNEPPTLAATDLLKDFLRMTVDALVRSGVNGDRGQLAKGESLHEQWLFALSSPQSKLNVSVAEVGRLREQIEDWRRPIVVTTAAPFRLCFRLEEPAAEAEERPAARDWNLRYLLQAVDDPSLLVPVADAWTARGKKAAVLRRDGFETREYLLAALGQAASIDSHLEESLKQPAPTGCRLDNTGAHAFLTDRSWLLEQAGFGVLLPAWWSRTGTKTRLSVRAQVKSPKMQGGSGLSLDEIVQFDWQVALGDHPLTLSELEALAQLKAPLVKVRGQWVQVSAEEIQAALDFWSKQAQGEGRLRDVVRLALGGGDAPGNLAVAGVTATGWIADFLAQLEGQAAFAELPPPAGFQGRLRPYQVRGYSWLGFLRRWGLGACLADDMGLGKTVQTLALIERDWEANGRRPTLLVCPMSVVGNWQKEAARFTPNLPVLVHHGGQRQKGPAFRKAAEQHALVLSSYGLLHRDLALFQAVAWAGVVLDEAQNIKNPETRQAQAARSLKADYRVALTGTPVENHVGDLWSILEFLNPGFLGAQASFKRSYFIPIQAYRDPDAAQRLKRLTGPFVLRRLKTDKSIIADLPDKLEMKVFCTLTREQASLYAAVVDQANQTFEQAEPGIQRRGLILATLSKLKQVCNHPAQFLGDNSPIPGRSGKLARLTEMLEEILEAGDRALVFTQFTEMGTLVKRHLEDRFGREVLFLHGATTKKQRDHLVQRFQSSNGAADSPRVFVLSLKAGGTGLNLTAANHVFHFDRWWNPAVEDQATDRAFRIGQTRNVQVHKFLCAGTLEEKIDEMIQRKQEVARNVVGTGEAWLTELSNEQLKDLFALRTEALGE